MALCRESVAYHSTHYQKVMTLIERIIRKVSRVVMLHIHDVRSSTQAQLSSAEISTIAQYREHIKIYDAFIFFNELELLELRLNILDPYVDYFVIVESTTTFSGKQKTLYFQENKDRFAAFAHKIKHIVIDDTPASRSILEHRLPTLSGLEHDIAHETLTNTNVPKGHDMWLREFYQRESIKKALVELRDTDFVFVSDVDEIWNPKITIDYRKGCIYKLRQAVYSYYLNNRSSEQWAGTFATQYRNIKSRCLGDMRDAAKTTYTYIENGGWHFTNQGGAARIAAKIDAYSHQEFNTDDVKNDLEKNITENKDFVGRSFTYTIDETSLPTYLTEHKTQYEHLFR